MSYQTSSKRSPPFWLLIDARKLLCFSVQQSEGRTAATNWNWSGKTLSPGALLAVLIFTFLRAIFSRPFRLSLAPTICPWVPEDDLKTTPLLNKCKGKWGRGRTKNSPPFSSPYYWSQYTLEKEKEHKPRSAISSPVLFGGNISDVVVSGAVSLKSMTLAFLTVRS